MFKGKLTKTVRACVSTVLTASMLLSLFPVGLILPYSSSAYPVAIADTDQEGTPGNLIVLQRTMKDSSGNNYTFTATYDSNSGLPSDAELLVEEITSGEELDAYLTETQTTLESETISYAHFFDISIVKDGVELQPQDGSKVNMQILLEDAQTEDLNVVHFTDTPGNGSAEVVENITSSEGDTTIVEFDAEGFSVYGVVSTILTTTITSSDGMTYKITVTYDDSTGIPEDAELKVSEVSEADYLSYLTSATEAIGESIHNVAYGKLFDISIVKDGVEYQPVDGSSLKVKVELLDAEAVEDVKVVHFEGDAAQEIQASTDGMTVSFETDGFSVFSFLDFSLVTRMVNATINGAVTAVSGTKSGTLYENDDIILSGSMPSNGIVEAERVDVSINGQDALLAYDIKIYANSFMKALGINWQPSDGAIQVQLKSDALTSEWVDVYHMSNTESPAELVSGGIGVVENSVIFDADSFSVYVIIEHEDGEVVTPRVAFHYISPNYQENETDNVFSYTAPAYEFLNKHNEYQITQILRDGEELEQIVNPPNKKDAYGNEVSFFYGWYTVDVADRTTDDTTALNSNATSSPYYNGDITYTWPNPQKVDDQTPIDFEVTDSNGNGEIDEGDILTWTLGNATGTAELDAEGMAHVYIVPVYEDYYFLNFHMGNKEANEGLRNNLLTRRLVVFGQNTTATVRIGDVEGPSPDPAHEIFAGWETVDFSDPSNPQTDVYYETLDLEGNEKDILHNGTSETAGESGTGYRIIVTEADSALASLDLYPVFAEARWVYFNTGRSGNGAAYVGAQYRLTNDENKGTAFASFPTTSRPGYDFNGWYLSQEDYNGSGTQITDGTGAFVAAVKGKTFYGNGTTISTDPSAGEKLFEITSDGKLYLYKSLDSLTLYANWSPKTVDYTVVYWLENANDDDYTLMYYKVMQGVAGDTTAAAPTAENETYVQDGVTHYPYTENKLRFMHLSTDQDKSESGNQSGIQQKEIEGDGSTIVNVYYDRNVYRLRFDIGFSQTTNGTLGYVEMTSEEAAGYIGTVYGYVNGQYVALTSDGNGGWAYPGTVTTRHAYNGYRYQTVTNNNGTQYGVVNGQVEELSLTTGTEYYLSRYNTAGSAEYTGTIYDANNNTVTNPVYPTTYYRGMNRRNALYWLTRSAQVWSYNGNDYSGTRYLRVSNGDANTSYTLGFVDGAMRTVSNDASGWYYNTQDAVLNAYSGPLYKQSITGGTTTYYVSNLTNSYNGNTDRWENFLTSNTVNLGTTNPFSPSEYNGTYISGNQYTVYYYDIVAKYGENILDQYPGSQTQKRSGNNTYSFVGWIPQADSFYWEKVMSSIKGFFETMSEDLILTGGTPRQYQNNGGRPNTDPNDYVAVTIEGNNTVTGEYGVTQEFRCRYKSGGGYNYLYRIYLADPETREYSDEPTTKIVVTAGSGSTPNLQTAPSYQGYTLVDSKVLTSVNDTTGVTPTSTTYSYAVTELTDAGLGNGMIMVFRFQPNQHHLTFKYGSGAEPALVNTEFGAAEEYYYDQSLANANVYNDDAIAATPDGYSFAGWYENLDGVGNVFDFDTTMPDGDIILYAVYKPVRYRVIVDPNGAEIDHIDHTGNAYNGTYNGTSYNHDPFNRLANGERAADEGYNRSQATYINGTYGTTISEYAVSRNYVPIGNTAAENYDKRLYYYVNCQYNSSDGSGLPSDLRSALYIDVTDGTGMYVNDDPNQGYTELYQYYDFWHWYTQTNFDLMPASFTGMTAQNLSFDQWKSLYVDKHDDGVTPQLYRKCNEKENWVFLGWFKDNDDKPYNFNDPVEGSFTLTAHWRLDGGYTIQYTPVYWLDSEDSNRYLINGAMDEWIDPDPDAATGAFSYTDGALTTVYKQPTDLTKNGAPVEDNSINFLGWRIVSVSTTTVNGQTVVTYTPLEDGVLYDPGDDFIIDVQYADGNNIIHMQAVYEETGSSVRRPEVANLTLDANENGYLVDETGTEIENDTNIDWDGVGTVLMDASEDQIVFGDIQSNVAIHLYEYATNDSDTGLTGGTNYFKHREGYLLLGFDPQSDPDQIVWVDPQNGDITGDAQPYVPNYPADSVISVQRTDNELLYAIWEPMVYATFKNETEGTVTFGLSSADDALEVINVKQGMYKRIPLSNTGEITLAAGESITLAFPKGAEKSIKVSGTNNLGPGKVLIWNTSIELEDDRLYDTAAETDPDESYTHTVDGLGAHSHDLAHGEKNNLQNFSFDEDLIVNRNPLTITFTSRDNAYALILQDNWNGDGTGGGTQEIDYGLADIQPDEVTGEPKSQDLPTTSTRFGYSFLGWAYSETATTPDFPVTGNMQIPDLNRDTGFFSTGTVPYGENDEIITRTLYAVWEPLKDAVYIFKDVPDPGNPNRPFDFTVEITGSYHVGTNPSTGIDESKTFSIKHGEYLRIVTTVDNATNTSGGHNTAFIQAEVEVYSPVTENGSVTYVKDTGRSGIVRWERSVTPSQNNGFDSMQIIVTETPVTYYTTSVTLDYEEHAGDLKLSSDPQETFAAGDTVDTNVVYWTYPDAHGTVTYNNVIDTYDVSVSKELIRNTSESEDFRFTASYILDENTPYPYTVERFTDESPFIVTSGETNSAALTGIPAGAVLTITEGENDDYDTTIAMDATETDGKEISFTVTKDTTVGYTNTLKSYPVKFIKVDQNGTPGVVAATFNLVNTTKQYNLGTNLQAYDNTGSDGVFYTSGTNTGSGSTYEPLYAGQTYTLTEIFTESGYIGLDAPVTIKVSGDEDAATPFTFSNPDVTAEWDSVNEVWKFYVKNKEVKDITIVKAFNDPLLTQRTFKFSWSYEYDSNGDEVIDPATEIYSGTFTLTPISGSTARNKLTIPVGAKNLLVTELHTNNGADQYGWVATAYDTTVRLEIVELHIDETEEDYYETIDVISTEATITFTNTRKTVPVTVNKKVVGAGGTFTFEALLTYSAAVSNYTLNDNDMVEDETDDLITDADGKATFTLSPERNGTDSIVLNVPYGAYLTVTETSTGPFGTTVQLGEESAESKLTTGQLTITEPITITFTNSEVTIAPTGYGDKTVPYIWVFALSMAIVIGIDGPYFYRKRKSREEEEE